MLWIFFFIFGQPNKYTIKIKFHCGFNYTNLFIFVDIYVFFILNLVKFDLPELYIVFQWARQPEEKKQELVDNWRLLSATMFPDVEYLCSTPIHAQVMVSGPNDRIVEHHAISMNGGPTQ